MIHTPPYLVIFTGLHLKLYSVLSNPKRFKLLSVWGMDVRRQKPPSIPPIWPDLSTGCISPGPALWRSGQRRAICVPGLGGIDPLTVSSRGSFKRQIGNTLPVSNGKPWRGCQVWALNSWKGMKSWFQGINVRATGTAATCSAHSEPYCCFFGYGYYFMPHFSHHYRLKTKQEGEREIRNHMKFFGFSFTSVSVLCWHISYWKRMFGWDIVLDHLNADFSDD